MGVIDGGYGIFWQMRRANQARVEESTEEASELSDLDARAVRQRLIERLEKVAAEEAAIHRAQTEEAPQ